MLRFVDDGQRRAKAVFGRLATGMKRADFTKVPCNIHPRRRPISVQSKSVQTGDLTPLARIAKPIGRASVPAGWQAGAVGNSRHTAQGLFKPP